MIGMQSSLDRSLDRILNAIQMQSHNTVQPSFYPSAPPNRDSPYTLHRSDYDGPTASGSAEKRAFPPLPGFPAPVSDTVSQHMVDTDLTIQPHKYASYGIVVPSTSPSSDDESEETLPRATLDAPIQALQGLANAAAEAAAAPSALSPRFVCLALL
jgi:hypothetical protein